MLLLPILRKEPKYVISITRVDDRRRSLVICDHCKKPILDSRLAVALVDELGDKNALHAHKGICHDAVEKNCISGGRIGVSHLGFMELGEHLAQLVHNSNVQNSD